MKASDYKCIVGYSHEKNLAAIRFDGPVNQQNVEQFKEEFLYLQRCNPDKITVFINSEGGSVVHGMTVFSLINSCPIEVHCVVEGIAASIASVIWAAGDKLFMHDYSLLMMHNPFLKSDDGSDDSKQVIKAFKEQLVTIYTKRLGMSKTQVKKIMDGEGDADGTFMTAQQAVDAKILPAKNIIKTNEQVRADITELINDNPAPDFIRNAMASIPRKIAENKLIEDTLAILNKTENLILKSSDMNEKELTFDSVCAQLGFATDAPVANVPSRVTELLQAEASYKEVAAKMEEISNTLEQVNAEFDTLKIQYKGKEAELANVVDELAVAKESLKNYQEAEASAKAAKIEEVVNKAIEDGKITAESKDEWVAMAQSNFSMVEQTLASIAVREKISEAIASDPINVENAAKAVEGTLDEVEARINEVLGKKFSYNKF